MGRLPIPGKDSGAWGAILNDYLLTEHNVDGTHKLNTLIDTDVGLSANSDQKAPSQRAVKAYVDGHVSTVTLPDATGSIKGALVLAGDLGGTASDPGVRSRTASKTIGTAGMVADFICDGVDDHVQIQAAMDALGSGGTLLMRPGAYRIGASIQINTSQITLSGSGAGLTMLVPATGMNGGLISINGQAPALSQVRITDIGLDIGGQAGVRGIDIKGGTDPVTMSVDGVYIERCSGQGLNTNDVGFVTIYSGLDATARGPVENVTMRDCTFGSTNKYQVYVSGSGLTNLMIDHCTFKDSQIGAFAWSGQNLNDNQASGGFRSHQNWTIKDCRFSNYRLNPVLGPRHDIGLIQDSNRVGVRGFKIHHNYFDEAITTVEQYAINVMSVWDLEITSNTFYKNRTVFSIGQSNNGPWFQSDPENMASIKDNRFIQCFNIVDHDASVLTLWKDNFFYETFYAGLGGYSRHWPSQYQGNIFYNSPADPSAVGALDRAAAFHVWADGIEIKDNIVIDDRKLPDPTLAPVLGTVSGTNLLPHTYYVAYSWKNDTGETLLSPEASITVPSGSLLKVTHPYTTNYGPPTGAKEMRIYAGTSSGNLTLQDYVPTPWQSIYEARRTTFKQLFWIEPASGLVNGDTPPGSNTTFAILQSGIHEWDSGIEGPKYPNTYSGNHFYGFGTPATVIDRNNALTRIQRNNMAMPDLATGVTYSVENTAYDLGNVAGGVTVDVGAGECQRCVAAGDTNITLTNGHYVGQALQLQIQQDAVGGRAITMPGNFKAAAGGILFSSGANAIDTLCMSWNSTDWIEIARPQSAGTASLPQDLTTSGSPTFASETLNGNLTLGANANRSIVLGRNSTTAGDDLTIAAGGARSGGTNLNGGVLTMSSGMATGSGSSRIDFNTVGSFGSGTADRTPTTKMNISGAQNGRLAIGLGTTTSTWDGIALGGLVARTIAMIRSSTANAAGNQLLVQSGGASSGGTNRAAGDLVLATGLSTGNAGGTIRLQTPTPGASGTGDTILTTRLQLDDTALTSNVLLNMTNHRITNVADPLNAQDGATKAYVDAVVQPSKPRSYTAQTSNYAVTNQDGIVSCDATAGSFAVTLPAATGLAGREFTIKRSDTSGNTVTVVGLIDGAANHVLAGAGKPVITVASNGTNWEAV